MTNTFIDLSIVLFSATLVSIITKLLKQPLIIGYIITGLIVGPYFADVINNQEVFEICSQLGISLLLFLVGLHLSPSVIKELGKSAVIIGISQIIVTFAAAFGFSLVLGFGSIESAFIAIALTFSSTIIVLKTLNDKNDLDSLYSKLSIGILLVQDLVAIFVLIFLGGEGSGSFHEKLIGLVSNGLIIYGVLSLFVIFMLPRISSFFAKSQEILFLTSISYAIGLAALFSLLGFSIEIGSLIAGVTLTFFPYHLEIASKLKPLRDFFIILFFISLGASIKFDDLNGIYFPVFVLIIFVVIIKPIIASFISIKAGYKHKTSINMGLTMGQVSEFSLILLAKNIDTGIIDKNILSLVTLVALISMAVSSFEMNNSFKIAKILSKYFKNIKQTNNLTINFTDTSFDAVLFGYNRFGFDIIKSFKALKLNYFVIDYDPEVINLLTNKKVPNQYGDLDDLDFLEDLPIKYLELIVSTVPNYSANYNMLKLVKRINKKCIVILLSHNITEAKNLYQAGASYVIMPHFLGAKYAENLIVQHGINGKKFVKEKERHVNYLNKRLELGHQYLSYR